MAGIYSNYDHRWAEAEAEYRKALRLNANYATAHQWYANHLVGLGRHLEAQERILRAQALDPLSLIIQVNVANVFLLGRDYDRAIEECGKALKTEPDFVHTRWVRGRAYALKGQLPQALDEFRRGLARESGNMLLRAALARAHAVSGARNEARSLLRELEAARRTRYVSALNLASVYEALGQLDDAFASLDQAVGEHANLLIYLAVDPDYDSLRGESPVPQGPAQDGARVAARHRPPVPGATACAPRRTGSRRFEGRSGCSKWPSRRACARRWNCAR